MLFDQAATIIERHLPSILKRIERSRIFLFPGRAQDILPKQSDADTVAALHENFFLPFDTIAVEDAASCVVLWDTKEDQRGLDGERGFINIEPLDPARVGAFREGDDPEEAEKIKAALAQYPPGAMLICEGRMGPIHLSPDKEMRFMGTALWAALATKDGGVLGVDAASRPKDRASLSRLSEVVLKNVNVAFQEVFYFNSPERFILEECPVKAMERYRKRQQRKGAKHKEQIRRRSERPVYTLLRPNEIRKRLKLPPLESHGPRTPHERRRHARTYRDKRYTKMRGKTVIIPATWIGPSEATIGNRRYRILLDK